MVSVLGAATQALPNQKPETTAFIIGVNVIKEYTK